MSDLLAIIDDAVFPGTIPGAVAALGRGPVTLETWVAGLADATPGAERAMTPETLFDLASLTKVVATTTLVLALTASGSLELDGPAARYLPAVPWDVTIRQLLSHTSGLPATVKFYQTCSSRAEVLDALFATPLQAPPGTRVAYSDLGFMTLGEIVAAVTGSPLDAAFRDLVALPLGLADTGFLPPGPPSRFAATELADDGTPWTGIVHDENARTMGGVAGHAGLFAPAADLARFAAWWVSPSGAGPVPLALRREAGRCQTPGLPGDGGISGRRGLGWVLPGDRYDILAGAWPETAMCHSGFTGTSLALDPASGAWLVLLTNRVHAGRSGVSPAAIKALRRTLHTAVRTILTPGLRVSD
ncbi:MAG: beta-lactamase family protein [Nocardiopsaceae bacterium]|nr:beta-lactamase family protein [Nocardiopsaceae bacterium]